jgi:TatD DNase family protein
VVIHCRDAELEALALLEGEGFADYPLLWHCFGGNAHMAERIVRNGWHISVPGPVTFPANKALREAVASIPADRLLVETDCPYLSPEPLRGKRNEPANLGYIIAAMAEVRGVPASELWTLCGDNARRFFRLDIFTPTAKTGSIGYADQADHTLP